MEAIIFHLENLDTPQILVPVKAATFSNTSIQVVEIMIHLNVFQL